LKTAISSSTEAALAKKKKLFPILYTLNCHEFKTEHKMEIKKKLIWLKASQNLIVWKQSTKLCEISSSEKKTSLMEDQNN
jgi:hypothetical protein